MNAQKDPKSTQTRTSGAPGPIVQFMEIFFPLAVIWFVLSGLFEVKFIFFGLATCAVIAAYCRKHLIFDGIKSDRQYFLLHIHPGKLLMYAIWLMKEIIKAALDISKVILPGHIGMDPHIIWFRADYDNPAARTVLANSITLTPGTITIDIYKDGVFSVHALTIPAAEGLLDGTMQQKVANLFGEEIQVEQIEVIDLPEDKKKVFSHLLQKKYPKAEYDLERISRAHSATEAQKERAAKRIPKSQKETTAQGDPAAQYDLKTHVNAKSREVDS